MVVLQSWTCWARLSVLRVGELAEWARRIEVNSSRVRAALLCFQSTSFLFADLAIASEVARRWLFMCSTSWVY